MTEPNQELEEIQFPFTVSLPLWGSVFYFIFSLILLLSAIYFIFWFFAQTITMNPWISGLILIVWMAFFAYVPGLVFLYAHTSLKVYRNFIEVRKLYGLYRKKLNFSAIKSFQKYEKSNVYGFNINLRQSENPQYSSPLAQLELPIKYKNLSKLEKVLEKNNIIREAQ